MKNKAGKKNRKSKIGKHWRRNSFIPQSGIILIWELVFIVKLTYLIILRDIIRI